MESSQRLRQDLERSGRGRQDVKRFLRTRRSAVNQGRFSVPRLSCVIPVVGSIEDLETTLVSVLEHRPDDCEIIVVLNRPYADPYGLEDEIRFVEFRGAGMAACATLGIQLSRASIVHVLAAGLEVAEGWTAAALPHFADPEIAAVAPVIRDSRNPACVLAAGVRYHRGGRRSVCKAAPNSAASRSRALGPSIDAGFYRKSALEALGDGLPTNLGDELADVDLALGLHYAGFETVVEPQCAVFADRLADSDRGGFRTGLHAERLFLRNLPVTGWLPAFLLHPYAVAEELLRSLPRGSTLTQIAGRLAAWFSLADYRLHHHLLSVAREIVNREIAERAVIAKLPVPEEAAPESPARAARRRKVRAS
jgi:hypothetical protein